MYFNLKYFDDIVYCRSAYSLPLWETGVVIALVHVLFPQPLDLLPVAALPEHIFSLVLIEGTAHAAICGLLREYGRATHSSTLPLAIFQHS